MEFNIRKGATLPFIEVNLIKDGRTDYNYVGTNLSGNTIYFYMKNVETGFYKISNSIATFSTIDNTIYYQFTKKILILLVGMKVDLKYIQIKG